MSDTEGTRPFEELVADVIDNLPDEFQKVLADLPVVVSDDGARANAYAKQVERTLRHELAHHLGWDERGVGGLGL